jgi:hypothetical protein
MFVVFVAIFVVFVAIFVVFVETLLVNVVIFDELTVPGNIIFPLASPNVKVVLAGRYPDILYIINRYKIS